MSTLPSPALRFHAPAGRGGAHVLLVAPHATTPLGAAVECFVGSDDVQESLHARVADWHDEGSGEAMLAAADVLGAPGARPTLPRGVLDLNRGWKGRVEAKETLFGKGALDAWTVAHLVPGAEGDLELWYREALGQLAGASAGARGFVEVHSYGDLGSTYDRDAGGRPVRRPEAAIIEAVPWATAYPVGLARLLPGDLRGTPWELVREVGDALGAAGFRVGPSPYPSQGPWALSTRFLAARWFAWLARSKVIPVATALRLAHHAWHDEQAAEVDAIAAGGIAETSGLVGVAELAKRMGAWSHDAGDLGRRFLEADGAFTLVVELRVDRAAEAEAFGRAVGAGVGKFLDASVQDG